MGRAIVVALLATLLASCGIVGKRGETPMKGRSPFRLPSKRRIADADPSIRKTRIIRVPSLLSNARTDSSISVFADTGSFEEVSLDVGYNMIVGFKYDMYVTSLDLEPRWIAGRLGGAPSGSFGTFHKALYGFPEPAVEYRFEMVRTVFETDVPGQHAWMPKSDKYKILRVDTLTAISRPLAVDSTGM